MIAATFVAVALRALLLTADTSEAKAHAPPAAAVEAHPAPAAHEAAPAAEHQQPGEHGAAMAAEHGAAGEKVELHGAAGGHGGGKADLGSTMMHHVADGYLIEYPGYCSEPEAGEEAERAPQLRWNCEWNLKHTFGHALEFGALDMTPTKHVVMMWLATALLLIATFTALRGKALVPRGFYNFFETLVAFVRNDIATPNIGKEHADRFLPYLLTAFFFILFVNLFGLLPYAGTATANISVTVLLALCTFFVTQYAAIRAQGVGGYLKHLTGGVPVSLAWLWPIMIPVEFLGLFTKPFALTVRLFANMVAGHFVILALLGLIYAISFWVFPVSVALALAIFMLELFVAFVQAYIFTMLSALFIGAGLVHHGHDEHHEDGPGEGPGHPEAAEAHH